MMALLHALIVRALSARAARTNHIPTACACEALPSSCAHLLASRAVRLVWHTFWDDASVERRNLSVVRPLWSFFITYRPLDSSAATTRRVGDANAIGRFATRTLLFPPPVGPSVCV